MQDLPCYPRGHSFTFAQGSDSGGRRVVTPNSHSNPVEARPGWHAFFSDTVRFVLAPLVLLFSGFFTANFIISGAYTWPLPSPLCLTASRPFVTLRPGPAPVAAHVFTP